MVCMEIVEQSTRLLVCHESARAGRFSGAMLVLIGLVFQWLAAFDPASIHGPRSVVVIAGVVLMVVGIGWALAADDNRIVIDAAAQVVRLTRDSALGVNTTELPFGAIADVALEGWRLNGTSGYRAVFVRRDGTRIAWTRMSNTHRRGIAAAVAAARMTGGWHELPVASAPSQPPVMRQAGGLVVVGVVFVVGVLWALVWETVPLLTWKPVAAVVLRSDVNPIKVRDGSVSYLPTITYRYVVGGQTYTSSTVSMLTAARDERSARSVISRYGLGDTVTAYVDLAHPSRAFVERHWSMAPLFLLLLPGIPLLGLSLSRRANRQLVLNGAQVPVLARTFF
jgi:hypothetical protein